MGDRIHKEFICNVLLSHDSLRASFVRKCVLDFISKESNLQLADLVVGSFREEQILDIISRFQQYTSNPLQNLDINMVSSILQFCDLNSMCRCRSVCKKWYRATQNQSSWKYVWFHCDFKSKHDGHLLLNINSLPFLKKTRYTITISEYGHKMALVTKLMFPNLECIHLDLQSGWVSYPKKNSVCVTKFSQQSSQSKRNYHSNESEF